MTTLARVGTILAAFMVSLVVAVPSLASTVRVTRFVEGPDNPWLAGKPSTFLGGDGVAPERIRLHGARVVTLPRVRGCLKFVGDHPCARADGARSIIGDGTSVFLPSRGIAGLTDTGSAGATNYYLVGVYLPRLGTTWDGAPPSLNFTNDHDFAVLHPALRQPFFIGDGRTSDGTIQRFVAPSHAGRLFLGIADQCASPEVAGCYFDNSGGFRIRARLHSN